MLSSDQLKRAGVDTTIRVGKIVHHNFEKMSKGNYNVNVENQLRANSKRNILITSAGSLSSGNL